MANDAWVARIAGELQDAGVRPGGVVLVHSSLRALGALPGGAETVVQGLLRVLGDAGTLLMPALSYDIVRPDAPFFDVAQTPSNVGALPEYFRTRPGTLRSVHPTHSVCGIGALAEELLADHLLDATPCGAHSPFARLPQAEGQVLMLGCGLRPNTSMHAVEELVAPPYLYGPEVTYHLRLLDGTERKKVYRKHGFAGHAQRYDRLGPLLRGDGLHVGRCLQATVHCIESPVMWRVALAALRFDPLYFVDPL